ncbi:MAG: phosphoribosylanthranilate isomerase [Candidatus Omnitrophica bacterium]|nr:phosphoribosylanthranilate isomerase [Candidatus Omnitrophota bacterium]MDD5487464.1 phosphoribosylanthranilate isomerase [Candidatus Omnitrophota bacterium]
MTKVKICGITRAEDALDSFRLGADLIGLIFIKGTPRAVPESRAIEILEAARKNGYTSGFTGLFMDSPVDEVSDMVVRCGIDHVQLHGDESPEYCERLENVLLGKGARGVKLLKVLKVGTDGIIHPGGKSCRDYLCVDYFVFDTYDKDFHGGTGKVFNWDVLRKRIRDINKPFFLAGGLDPDNVARAVLELSPFGVDVSSGVEKLTAIKDKVLLREFIKNAKKTGPTG